ncbi:phosphatase PAP2 family protein [Streptomyces sp. GMY02]|uniref:phosphatase PAP2 family protein n=1 Tax=Streptomyces sp. GMY02 TaxID=1333528 RepID=UPI001C2CB5F8|nr:phosphatase PAP2 family protein [Streptomyces sp. GMY02]QXE38370.1 phosphatase PAP2 family protein [Streptomyces sp. GMY02]
MPSGALRIRTAALSALFAAAFALLAVLVTGRNGAPFPLDRDALDWSLDHRPPEATAVARGITATGTGVPPYLCAVVAGLLAGPGIRQWRRQMPDGATDSAEQGWAGSLRYGLPAAAGTLLFLIAGQLLRHVPLAAVHRSRPPAGDWATHASNYAFPSGHATTSALMAGLLIWALTRRRGGTAGRRVLTYTLCALIACWAVAVGLSRIYLGVHWATDVLGGWLYAAFWLSLGATLLALVRGPMSPGRLDRLPLGSSPGRNAPRKDD